MPSILDPRTVQFFPALTGLSWSTFKAPQFNTITQKAVSGRELRVAFQTYPTWLFTLKFDYLTPADQQALMGLFLLNQGSLGAFAFIDPTDNIVTRGYIATGDGITTAFVVGRSMGGFYEPIQFMTFVNELLFNGAEFGTDGNEWSVNQIPGVFFFATPPPVGTVITASFTFAFVCRFADDTNSFENFMYQLWSLKELKLQSVLL
jgi:hypothetical protein